jgi:hypothetical protein
LLGRYSVACPFSFLAALDSTVVLLPMGDVF